MKPSHYLLTLTTVLLLALTSSVPATDTSASTPRTRRFRLEIGATLHQLPGGSTVRVWLPIPPSNQHQQVKRLPAQLPAPGKVNKEPKYGNQVLYFQKTMQQPGSLGFDTSYEITRREVRGLEQSPDKTKVLSAQDKKLYLAANQNVPLTGQPLKLLEQVKLTPQQPLALAQQLYNRVDDHVRYDKSKPGYGNGDVLWVCDSQFGNCTDFHSLFISFARSQALPARFEIGFPLPPERGRGKIGGYHCWALFHVASRGWIPVDISEADKHPEMKEYYFGNLTENRVSFTTGRDINLVPRQDAPPLNYFVYPHIEVNGKQWPRKNIDLKLRYQDQ